MPSSRRYAWPVVILIASLLVITIALPQTWRGWVPSQLTWLRQPVLHLGLDLVGGTQLDFRISEEEMRTQEQNLRRELDRLQAANAPAEKTAILQAQLLSIEEQKSNLIEAIRTVLERRINALGVSEATITPSFVGDEKHLLVECPGIVDTQECIRVVGKTIQLEFKEEFAEATDEFRAGVETKADAALRRITVSGATLQAVGQDASTQLGVAYNATSTLFRDQLPKGAEDVWKLPAGRVVRRQVTITVPEQNAQGGTTETEVPGILLVQVLSPLTQTGRVLNEAPKAFAHLAATEKGASYRYHEEESLTDTSDPLVTSALKSMQGGELRSVATGSGTAHMLFLRGLERGGEQADVSHLLVSYRGASAAGPEVTRSKEEALERAQTLKAQLDKGRRFVDLARLESDGPSKEKGGALGAISRGTMVPAFEQVAFTLPAGAVSDPVETPFGYHLIRVNQAPSVRPDTASYDDVLLRSNDAASRANVLIAKLKAGQVTVPEEAITLRTLFFSLRPTGWKDTALDGRHFRSAGVSLDPVTNVPVVQIAFDEEGGTLFQELTRKNIGKKIAIFVGGELVSAPTVQQEIAGGTAIITGSQNIKEAQLLAQDLNTGAIPAPIHLVGQYTVEATLGAQALRTSLMAALVGTVILMIYMLLVYRLLGLVADLALGIYGLILFALLKLPLFLLSHTYVVLTTAGMAGIILSIGMAVDANVLVFERMKEELRKGKLVKTAVEGSFKHAWPAIRDSNISALITCSILFLIGTSIVKGFAITLGLGVLLSLFTAVTVTRWLLRRLVDTPLGQRRELFGGWGRSNTGEVHV